MFKIFLAGLGAGFLFFDERGKEVVKKYLETSDAAVKGGIKKINDLVDDKKEEVVNEGE